MHIYDFIPMWILTLGKYKIIVGRKDDPIPTGETVMTIDIRDRGLTITEGAPVVPLMQGIAVSHLEQITREFATYNPRTSAVEAEKMIERGVRYSSEGIVDPFTTATHELFIELDKEPTDNPEGYS